MIRIIDHKRVDLTNDELQMYQQICRSYDEPKVNRKGEDLFVDHFDVDGDGIITFVKPPSRRYSSLEVYCFLISIMQNQHMRNLYEQNKMLVKETSNKIKELMIELEQLKVEVKKMIGQTGQKSPVEDRKG